MLITGSRKQVVTRRCKFELAKAQKRQHIVEGLLKALKQLDDVIAAIKKSAHLTEALAVLQKKFSLSQKQAQAILETRLQQLTALEQNKLKAEHEELKKKITLLERILASEKEILQIIKKELQELKRKYADLRRTYILSRIAKISEKDIIAKKDVVITITDKGYVKRIGLKAYHEQKRGGRGVIGVELATGDFVKQIITCSTHDYLLFFTNRGKVYWLKAYQIPEIARYGKGKALVNVLNLKDEIVTAVIAVKKFENFLIMATLRGMVKKISLSVFSKPRSTGVKAINLPENDLLIDVKPLVNEEIMLVTKQGQAIRFDSQEIREMGRAAYGVTGIKLDKNDEVVSLEVLPSDDAERKKSSILTITSNGYGKRSNIEDYRKTARAGKGVINIKTTGKTGTCIKTVSVKQNDSIIATTAKGMVIRVPVKDIRIMGRATQGVRIIKLQEADKVTDLIKINKLEE
jgi:DNA gyrase subunit A